MNIVLKVVFVKSKFVGKCGQSPQLTLQKVVEPPEWLQLIMLVLGTPCCFLESETHIDYF